LGCAQTPVVLHRADAGCTFVSNAFITKRRDRPEFFSKEGLWSVIGYWVFVFSAALFVCAARPHSRTGGSSYFIIKVTKKDAGEGTIFFTADIVLNTNPTPYYKGIGYWGAKISTAM